MSTYTDQELLAMWHGGYTKMELARLIYAESKRAEIHLTQTDALRRVERVLAANQFRLAEKPVPKEWR